MINPNEIYKKLLDVGDDWADKAYASDILEETQKSVLSECMLMETGGVSERDMKARASERYLDHVYRMVAAKRELNKARVKYDSVKSWVEAVRTAESTKRAEMRL